MESIHEGVITVPTSQVMQADGQLQSWKRTSEESVLLPNVMTSSCKNSRNIPGSIVRRFQKAGTYSFSNSAKGLSYIPSYSLLWSQSITPMVLLLDLCLLFNACLILDLHCSTTVAAVTAEVCVVELVLLSSHQ